MNQQPKVSVIIAVYNNKEYLPDAINSALQQDYPNLDIWICDDCSTEKVMPEFQQTTQMKLFTPSTLERNDEISEYEYRYATAKKIHYIRLKKNSGPSVARNIAIANAMRNGSHLFQILDSDDVMYPNKVSELIWPILQNPESVALAYADYNIVNEQGFVRYESKPVFDWLRLMNVDCHIHSGSLVNGLAIKDFYPNFYPEDQRVCEDYALWIKTFRQQKWVGYHIGKPLTYVRSHRMDSTNSVQKEIWQRDYHKALSYR